MITFLRATSQIIAFDGDDDAAAKAAAEVKAKADAEAAAAAAAAAAGDKQFNQEQVNTFLAEEKRKHQTQQRKMAADLEELKKTATLTTEQKEGLEQRIEELQTQYMTIEEKARRAEEAAKKEYDERVETLTKERNVWQIKHSELVIDTEIIKAAADQKALFCEQITALLTPKTKLTEKLDDAGKPTGDYEPKVAFPDTDKDDKPILLELTVAEAVKRMKELPKYGNLFEGGKVGGLGGTGSTTSGKPLDLVKIAREDPETYRELRKKRMKNA